LRTEAQALPVALGQRVPGFFVEDVAEREVVERYPQRTDDAAVATPTGGKLKLIGWFFFYRILDVYRAAVGVDRGVDAEGLLVEVAEADDLTLRTNDVGAGELLPGPGKDLPANYVLVRPVVNTRISTSMESPSMATSMGSTLKNR